MGKISFFYEDIDFKLSQINRNNKWIQFIINKEDFNLNHINFIFCSDTYLHSINIEYLNHDTLTDIITFDYSEGNTLEGEIYISIDRVKDNAEELGIEFESELRRVMAHGVLHMMGYGDKNEEEKSIMRLKEDSCISLYQEILTVPRGTVRKD